MKAIKKIQKAYKEKVDCFPNFEGATFIRDAAHFINTRSESLNEGKSPLQLLSEYATEILKDEKP